MVHTSIKVFADKFYEELVRRVYTTPKSYLDLINSYTAKLGALQGAVETKAQQMEVRGEGTLFVGVWCTLTYGISLFSQNRSACRFYGVYQQHPSIGPESQTSMGDCGATTPEVGALGVQPKFNTSKPP